MTVKVVHIKNSLNSPGYKSVYIGRGYSRDPRMENSGLGNPFKLGPHESRGATIERFKEWCWREYNKNPEYKEKIDSLARRVKKGENIELVCFCKPNPCHGDILKKFIDWLVDNNKV